MKQTTALVGPRGWAALVLAGGAAFATPFLRSTPNSPAATVADGTSEPDYSTSVWPDGTVKNLIPDAAQSAALDDEWQAIARMQSVSTLPRPGTGDLPSTAADRFAPRLPSWAEQNRRVDQVVDSIKSLEPLEPTPSNIPEVKPQRPWIDTRDQFIESSSAGALANSLAGSVTNDPADPFGRWTSSTPNSGTYSSNQPVKPFEDRPKLWPDQKVEISQLPGVARPGISAIVQAPSVLQPSIQSDIAAPVQQSAMAANDQQTMQSPIHAEPAQGRFVQSPVAQLPSASGQSVQHAFGSNESSPPRVEMSSASRREPMGASPNPPILPPSPLGATPSPTTNEPNPQRQRQFIFQPPKKA